LGSGRWNAFSVGKARRCDARCTTRRARRAVVAHVQVHGAPCTGRSHGHGATPCPRMNGSPLPPPAFPKDTPHPSTRSPSRLLHEVPCTTRRAPCIVMLAPKSWGWGGGEGLLHEQGPTLRCTVHDASCPTDRGGPHAGALCSMHGAQSRTRGDPCARMNDRPPFPSPSPRTRPIPRPAPHLAE